MRVGRSDSPPPRFFYIRTMIASIERGVWTRKARNYVQKAPDPKPSGPKFNPVS